MNQVILNFTLEVVSITRNWGSNQTHLRFLSIKLKQIER